MASEGNGFTHCVVSKEVVLGEACVIEKCLFIMNDRHFYSVSQTITESLLTCRVFRLVIDADLT